MDNAALVNRLDACPLIGSLWRHYRGTVYIVSGCAIREHDLAPLVLYYRYERPTWEAPVTFARPLAEWQEPVEIPGGALPRFRREEKP